MRARLISTFLLLFTTSFLLYSQDIYILKYKSPNANDKTTYDAFFSLSAIGTGIVRIKPVNNKNVTVEMTFQEEYASDKDGMPDMTKLIYRAMNPRVVMGDWNINVVPVTFWFKINADNFFDPWAVSTITGNSAPSESNFLSPPEFIKGQDMGKSQDRVKNRALVSNFFSDTSAYYKNIFVNSKGGGLSPEVKRNTHMYLIVVASTNDKSLEPNCLIDAKKIIGAFYDIGTNENGLGLSTRNIHIDSIYGNNYSRANVESALKRLPTSNKNNNLFIFYYSGHGFHDKDSADKVYPYFDLRDPTKQKFRKDLKTQVLNVQDIYDTIINKGARFNLVLSDCCNDTIVIPKRKWWETTKKKGLTKANFENVKTLFMSNKPVKLLLTAATKGEEAVITPSFSSYFTFFFLQSLTTYLGPEKGFPTWDQVFEATKTQTSRQVSGLCKEIKCPTQTPKRMIPGIK